MKWALATMLLILGALWAMPDLLTTTEPLEATPWSVFAALLVVVGVRWRIAFGSSLRLHDWT